ncbi:MAG: NirA family protein, partial [Pseudorhodoplanes sp.]
MSDTPDAIEFSDEQKRYLEGFLSGVNVGRAALNVVVPRGPAPAAARPASESSGPDAIHVRAQDRVLAEGKSLSDPEKFKRELHPFDAYDRLKAQARANEAPKPADNFRWRYFGLFYVAPNQTSYMCRLRIPNGILNAHQFAGLAGLAERYGGGYAHVTTRANMQIREIEPKNAVAVVEAVQDLGLCSRGSGADNIRNVTGTPTAGIDPQELIDTRPYAREWHFHILNERALYGLPRKFNVAFDGGGIISALEDTNDIGFQAVEVKAGFGVEPGVWFRMTLGGITGHRDFARDIGMIVKPQDATRVADALVRVYIENGNRNDRAKARLKYLLDAWGIDAFVARVEERLGHKLHKVPPEAIAPRAAVDRAAHIGVRKQRQPGLNWIGVALPVGRLSADQLRGLARVARDHGDGDIRLTVWQNLLISGVADNRVAVAEDAIAALGLSTQASATWHVEFDIAACGLTYEVGDSLGLYPANHPALVDAVIKALGAPPDFPIGGRPLRDVLLDGVSLAQAPDMLFQLFSYITGGERRRKARALATGEDPDGDAATMDVLAAIEKFPGVRPDPEAFIEALDPLQPRLNSISSSPKVDRGRETA